jgi:ERCC4-related helicase
MTQEAMFKKGDPVFRRDTRDLGHVQDEPVLDVGDYWYRIRFGTQTLRLLEDDLDPVDDHDESIESLVNEGRWGSLEAFRTAMVVERVAETNRSTVYSYRSQRILFQPYQYKPLLHILDSLDRRLLIADEVGLGKTIEAGLILSELEARQPVDKVLIVCPSRLRDKWREELNRKFDQEFEILDKKLFTQYVKRLRESPHRGRLRAVMSIQTIRNSEVREMIEAEISNFDVVIVDEAHHARNPATQTSEALRLLGQLSECMLLLTATPLHLGSRDLFTLLNALRPTEFRDSHVFEKELQRHRGVIESGLLARTRDANHLPQIEGQILDTFRGGGGNIVADPLARQVIEGIRNSPPTSTEDWISLERRIQNLHPLSSILTRTRKRDVQEHAPVRRAHVVRCSWTQEEDEGYQKLIRGAKSGGWLSEKLTIGEIQRARQAASCLPAAIEARYRKSEVDAEAEATDLGKDELAELGVKASPEPETLLAFSSWTGPDSKYDDFRTILAQIEQESPGAKVLVFSFFKGTVKYLHERLEADGMSSLVIHGEVPSTPLQPSTDLRGQRIEQFRNDSTVKVMISTEVGSEGLDFQFCHHVVNYDLPWNPMVVEQRIGRIDRFGQKSDVVHIHNLVVSGTVEDRILYRLYDRIGIFQHSIGDLENILGNVINELQRDYVSGELTPEEAARRVKEAEYAVKNSRIHLDELEQEAGNLFGHEEYIRSEMERVGRLGRYISEQGILAVFHNFIRSQHPDTGIWEDQDGVFAIRMTEPLRQDIQDAARREGSFWSDRTRDGTLRITMDGEHAFSNPEIELVNVGHPLMRAAVTAIQPRLETPAARVGLASLQLNEDEEDDLPDGQYLITVFAHGVGGMRARRIIDPVVWAFHDEKPIPHETGERLLHLVMENAEEPSSSTATESVSNEVWQAINAEIRQRHKRLRESERNENEALYVRRRRLLEAEHEFMLAERTKRLDTATRNHRSKGIIEAFRGQIAKVDAGHREKLSRLEGMQNSPVSLSEPVSACLVRVHRAGDKW